MILAEQIKPGTAQVARSRSPHVPRMYRDSKLPSVSMLYFSTSSSIGMQDEAWCLCFLTFMITEGTNCPRKADLGSEMYFVWLALDSF